MKELGSKDTYELYCEFLKNDLFYRENKKVSLGFTLSLYANIISEEDMNMDKWIKKVLHRNGVIPASCRASRRSLK